MKERKLALITGGTSGIGLGIAKSLANEYELALGYRDNHERAAESIKEISKINKHARVKAFAADLQSYKDAEHLLDDVRGYFKCEPAIFVHCAGTIRPATLLVQSNFVEIENQLNTHLLANMAIAKLLLPGMYANNFGRIVNMSSISSRFIVRGRCDYATAKAGVEGFTRALALEVAHRGITVNAVAPGLIETPMTQSVFDNILGSKARISKMIPVGFIGVPEDVAPLVTFLCSEAARYITGQTISVDGGRSLGTF
jgi:3-oxoacyl-[acyl-carrier protein] reductase